MKIRVFGVALTVFGLSLNFVAPAVQRGVDQAKREQEQDYYQKWLDEDVVYIITREERGVFKGLTTSEEKEQFIEQFWFRRDTDPRTANNEFKEEHYRRIAYANERFYSGLPGWMTDRGRIYIIHGPPAEITSRPSGGVYHRPMHEGGGTTSTYPFEVWRYRHVDGVGQDIELEFVDKTMTGEYRLTHIPEEKDAMLFVPGAGLTRAEMMGITTKSDRPFFSPGNRDTYPFMMDRAKDSPFARYEQYSMIQRPLPIRYNDLKELVEINITYDDLPFRVRQDYFRLNEKQVLVPVTIQLENKELTFKKEDGGQHRARVSIYGMIKSITNRIATEFDDDVYSTYSDHTLAQGLENKSIYQKIVTLDHKMRYKIDLVVKDQNSGRVGVIRKAIVPPRYGEDQIKSSSLILSEYIRELGDIPKEDKMFVLGDVWVRPNMDKRFQSVDPVGFYLQIYNVGFDQTTLEPSLEVSYQLVKDSKIVREELDNKGDSIQFFSGRRIVLVQELNMGELPPGRYQISVSVRDLIKDQELIVKDNFEWVEAKETMAQLIQ